LAKGNGPVFLNHSLFSSSVRWKVKPAASAVTGVPSWNFVSRMVKV